MHQYGEILQKILKKRGIKTKEEAEVFLKPDYRRDFHDPFLLSDMDRACTRLHEAIENNEKIVIYADYDCDGIPGAVILKDLLSKINYSNFVVYIPQRNSEGYGLSIPPIDEFAKEEAKLLITIDLGITAVEEVAHAKKLGIDTIVTDHHIPHAVLPEAYAILNPKLGEYPEKMLCGAGVVFKFAQGFVKKYGEHYKIHKGWEKWLIDMAGFATLSDMVPLSGENRAMSYFGMKVLRKSPRPGLQKLLAKVRIDQRYLNEDDIGFMVAPRLNAASRMDDPMRAYELLSTNDEKEAGILADHLSKINDDRKTMVTSIMREVNKKFEKREIREVIVIGNPKWQVGVLGLVASRVAEKYERPTFVWGRDENDYIKGSCRSSGGISLVELMTEARDSFLEFGGHEGAGGFGVDGEKVHSLEEELSLAFHKVSKKEVEAEQDYDIEASLEKVSMSTWREIDRLSPYGFGNPKPIFLFNKVTIENIKKFGKNGSGEHLEIIFKDDTRSGVKCIAFFSGLDSFGATVAEGKEVGLYATFELSRWRGRPELRLRIVDIV